MAKIIGADYLIYQDVDDLRRAVRDINPEIHNFEASCFDGNYITGNVSAEYLDSLERARLAPASQLDRDQNGESSRSQMNLQLSVE